MSNFIKYPNVIIKMLRMFLLLVIQLNSNLSLVKYNS